MGRQTITFVLDTGRDRDVLHWLACQENKSAAIRNAIRGAVRAQSTHETVTLTNIYQAILDLQKRNWALAPAAQVGDSAHDDEPPDVAAALDNLGL